MILFYCLCNHIGKNFLHILNEFTETMKHQGIDLLTFYQGLSTFKKLCFDIKNFLPFILLVIFVCIWYAKYKLIGMSTVFSSM